ncbi:TlpA family protein disulfide reductase [Tritonibacter sp. SIMBA_163]|uniref:TlpA family protein disulfide reductase n=1 Tax=Tritonibacter sp. SIMBA_163 TaxID=3080868 RepID=UPI00397FAE4E
MNRRIFLLSSFSLVTMPALVVAQGNVGVIFVGASWCAFCKSAAPVLAAMTQPAGIPVLVASHDARPIPPFAEMVDARTHPIASQIKALPTTMIYSQEAGTVTGQISGYRNARHYAQSVKAAILAAAGGQG